MEPAILKTQYTMKGYRVVYEAGNKAKPYDTELFKTRRMAQKHLYKIVTGDNAQTHEKPLPIAEKPKYIDVPDEDSMSLLVRFVAVKTGTTHEALRGARGKQEVSDARHMAAVLLKLKFRATQQQIGYMLGRDESSISCSLKTSEGLYRTNKQFRARLDELAAVVGVQVDFTKLKTR